MQPAEPKPAIQMQAQAQAASSQAHNEQQDPKALLKNELEQAFTKRKELISQLNKLRHRLAYKKSESEALKKLVELNDKYKNIGRLKHAKEVLEFKIATEARTLEDEKALLRRLGEVESQLKEALESQRLRNKAQLVDKDIEELQKSIESLDKSVAEADAKINELKQKLGMFVKKERKKPAPVVQQSISLEDVAVIKKKKSKDNTNQNPNNANSNGA